MALSYKKLWKLLIDKNLKKIDLIKKTGISDSTMSKLVKGENVNTDIINRICKALNCRVEEIVEYVEEEKND